ncbi:MAG: SDR family NAD(P)-dependent oxidoreductase, partial [Chromatiales bacterium]|nr:SDR family NAD(P)-dependent oxidoreductase [Chromatiales bacterium]
MSTRTALITGSGQNIGRGIAMHLAQSGHNVVINGSSNRDACDAVANEARSAGAQALVVMADIGKRSEAEAMAAEAIKAFGRVDILINNAAIRPNGDFLNMGDEA